MKDSDAKRNKYTTKVKKKKIPNHSKISRLAFTVNTKKKVKRVIPVKNSRTWKKPTGIFPKL